MEPQDLKTQLVKRIGAERSKRYFFYLNKLLSQKLSKKEFDNYCYRELGSENVSLHNQFVRSILNNVCKAKTPHPIHVSSLSKFGVQVENSFPLREDGHKRRGTVSLNHDQNLPIWSNGVIPMFPRKGRSGLCDHKLKDRPSPLGPNGKADSVLHPSAGVEDCGSKVGTDNGDVTPCDCGRPVQQIQPVPEMSEIEQEAVDVSPSRNSKIDQARGAVIDDGEVELFNCLSFFRSPLIAPLGIPACFAAMSGAQKTIPFGNSGEVSSYCDSGELSDTDSLRNRMEHILAAQGLDGVSVECANMLNNMLDVYLKRLIRSCVELVGAGSALHELKKPPVQKQQGQNNIINDLWPGNYLHMCRGSMPLEAMDPISHCSISLLDFKVAMELNPHQLGESWQLLLENICLHKQ
ncbi:hypothetical protein G4B88_010141 [Cannabis sativa]|uniref:Transcriptional coactivator Hfi1/Transcriptional adapter 1 n=1 Tax=Cannabis sativa TaxID=3483 RepID=A0A7J6DQC5_CANSA|nr:hypothetical protein G4B88_010141 [Cannabis sativa]